MANDGTVDQQQLQETLNEAYQLAGQWIGRILALSEVTKDGQLGELAIYETIEAAINGGRLGSADNVRAGIGFDGATRSGIGGFGTGLTSANYINDPDDPNLGNGFYAVNAADFSNPPNSSGVVYLEHYRGSTTGYQRVRSTGGSYSKVRTLNYDSGHGPWLSDPEWGSNGSGSFLKLPSGDAIAVGAISKTIDINRGDAVSGGYRSLSESITFPMTFASSPQVIPTNVYSGSGYLMDLSVVPLNTNATGTSLSWTAASSRSSQVVSANYFAFGRYV
ncbi:hypothetical protein [Salinicola rhizosphaerae]|uniref:Phage tail protein n=1 Tax=Salinicola rhizosphaerae TaxID=1443141 RepID=A0ABQ3E9G5_9GAMM|nr:hypothetical protein [Salinicola rhizosphaerae]GHB30391.1 hypothetical protein GCM10009038_31460 [Salinicola rhizosphaerae]